MARRRALYDAIYLGSHALGRRQGKKVMVVITDGGDTMSQVTTKKRCARQEAEAIIYSIIIVPIEADADATGGEHALIQISSVRAANITTPSRWRNWTKPFRKSATSCDAVSAGLLSDAALCGFKSEFRNCTWS